MGGMRLKVVVMELVAGCHAEELYDDGPLPGQVRGPVGRAVKILHEKLWYIYSNQNSHAYLFQCGKQYIRPAMR